MGTGCDHGNDYPPGKSKEQSSPDTVQ